jgi:DNA repair exonuclease SbcCD nuclease subunit
MTRIIHASDFQLGREFQGIGKSGDLVRLAMKESLEAAVKHALDCNADLFLVCGNLFAANTVSRHLTEFVYGQVERLGRMPFVVLPGQLDCIDENSVYRNIPVENRPDNLYILGDSDTPYLNFPDSEVTIYGAPCRGGNVDAAAFSTLNRQEYPGIHIALVAGAFSGEDPSESLADRDAGRAFEKSDFDYVAVGGWPSFRAWGTKSFSSGAPELQGFGLAGSGQVLLLDFNQNGINLEKIPIGKLVWKQIDLNSAKYLYNIEIEEELGKYAGSETLLRARVVGDYVRDGYLDLATLEQGQKERFCYLEIAESRTFSADLTAGLSISAESLLADYALLLGEAIAKAPPELKPQYLQALTAGHAMLSGKDVI